MRPTISVICPVRNMEGKLQNLENWVKLCDSSFQIVLVSDSSTDNTLSELKKIKTANPFSRIEIIEGLFGSPGCARNAGIALAEGEWVVFWDSDDVGNPKLLTDALQKYDPTALDAIAFGYEIYSGTSRIKSWVLWPSTDKMCIEKMTLNPGIWRFFFKKSSIRDIEFSNLSMAEDQLFINDFMRKSPQIAFANDVAYRYFVNRENQLTSSKSALEDLRVAAHKLSIQMGTDASIQVFTVRIFGKILITQIKKCRFPLKIYAAIKLSLLFLRYPKDTVKLFYDIVWGRIH